ncbi:MAG: dipicolinate synthase subunit DpsA [Blautia sp.]
MKPRSFDFTVMGGDRRQIWLARLLADRGFRICQYELPEPLPEKQYPVCSCTEEALAFSSFILAPLPLSSHIFSIPVSEFPSCLSEDQIFFAGCIPPCFREQAAKRRIRFFDYMENESLTLYNTIATAEGVVTMAAINSPRTLHRSRCLILGYGKCGRRLAALLTGMFCHVTVCARNPSILTEASLSVPQVVDFYTLPEILRNSTFDFIFNTVPAPVLGKDCLTLLNSQVQIYDIASAPGGVDFVAADRLRIFARLCPGLPGKYAPLSSAQAMEKMILSQIIPPAPGNQ